MKHVWKPKNLPLVTAALGGLGMTLRRLLYAFGADARGLLIPWHPISVLLTVLSVLTLGGIAAGVRTLPGSERYEDNFRPCVWAAAGHWLAAAGIGYTVLTNQPLMPNYLGQCWQCLGCVSPACLILAGIWRLRGKMPFFLLHLIPCLFLVFHVINHYQLFSGDPQFQDYIFNLLATMALMFFAFYNASFGAGLGNRRMQLGMGLAAVYLCLTELAVSRYPVLYLGGAAWALTDLCSLEPVPAEDRKER